MIVDSKLSLNLLSKILLVIGFSSLIFNLSIMIKMETPSTYEFSIYDVFPESFWASFLGSIYIGQLILVLLAHSTARSRWIWKYAIVLILLNVFLILFLPWIRNYPIYGRNDVLVHLGIIKDITANGWISDSNFYPAVHIYSVIISLVCNINKSPTLYIPQIFSCVYILFAIVYLKKTSLNNDEFLFSLPFAMVLVFNVANSQILSAVNLAPYAQSIWLIPLFMIIYFYILDNGDCPEMRLLMIILVLFSIICHPLIILTILSLLLISELARYLYNYYCNTININITQPGVDNSPYALLLIGSIGFAMWSINALLVIRSLQAVYLKLVEKAPIDSDLERYINAISQVKPDQWDLTQQILSQYGQYLILSILSVFSLLYLVYTLINRGVVDQINFIFAFIFIAFSVISSFLLISPSIFFFGRIFSIAMLLSLIMTPHIFYALYLKLNRIRKLYLLSILYISIILITYFSIFSLIPSPNISVPNEQVTESEYIGMSRLFSILGNEIPTIELGMHQGLFSYLIFGYNTSINRINKLKAYAPLDHFGYDRFASLSATYNHTKYILLNTLGKYFYNYMYLQKYGDKYKNSIKFVEEDFLKLNHDNRVASIYKNGNIELYLFG